MDFPADFLRSFEPLETLGSGAMGVVIRARQLALGRDVVVKFLREDVGSDPQARQRFVNEARICAGLRHPNVAPVLDVDTRGRWIVFAYVPGHTLDRAVRRDGRMPVARVLELADAAAAGLEFAHARGVVHRDIKPDNLLLGDDGSLRILDFGYATARSWLGRLTQAGTIIGTPSYMSPEQALGEEAGQQADVYGLGATVYGLLAGRPPFVGDELQEVLRSVLRDPPEPLGRHRPDVPAPVEQLVLDCLEKDPAGRPPGMAAFQARLAACACPTARATSFSRSATVSFSAARLPLPGRSAGGPVSSRTMRVGAPAIGQTVTADLAGSSRFQNKANWLVMGGAAVAALLLGFVGFTLTSSEVKPPALDPKPPEHPTAVPSSAPEPTPYDRLGAPDPAERTRALKSLTAVPGRRSRTVRCLALTGGTDPFRRVPMPRESDPAVRRELVASLRATGDLRAVPALLDASLNRKDPASEAAVAALGALTGHSKLLTRELVVEWARQEAFLASSSGAWYQGQRGRAGPRQGVSAGLDFEDLAASEVLKDANRASLDGDPVRARILYAKCIWMYPSSVYYWLNFGNRLLHAQGRAVALHKASLVACANDLDKWEWLGVVPPRAAELAGLPLISLVASRGTVHPEARWRDSRRALSLSATHVAWKTGYSDVLDWLGRNADIHGWPCSKLASHLLAATALGREPAPFKQLVAQVLPPSRGTTWADAMDLAGGVMAGDAEAVEGLARALEARSAAAGERVPAFVGQARDLVRRDLDRQTLESRAAAAIAGEPEFEVVWWMAVVWRGLGRSALAAAAIDRACKLKPELLLLPNGLIRECRVELSWPELLEQLRLAIYLEAGRASEALEIACRLARMNVPDAERFEPLFSVVRGQGAAALEMWPRIETAAKGADSPRLAILRALVLLEGGRPADAVTAAETACDLFAKRHFFEPCEALLILSEAHRRLGRTSEAAALLRLAASAPDCLPLRSRLLAARALAEAGDGAGARRKLADALVLDPLHGPTLAALACEARARGETTRARELALRAVRLARLEAEPACEVERACNWALGSGR